MDVPIIHHESRSAFLALVDGKEAELHYTRLDPSTVAFDHTFVPPELRGRGIAERLATTALGWARAAKLTVVPACSYLSSYLSRHPEWDDLRAARGSGP